MDTSRRLVLFALLVVLAKTVDPSLPIMLRYYMLIAWVYGRRAVRHLATVYHLYWARLDDVPRRLLVALAGRLGIAKRRDRKLIYYLLNFGRLMADGKGDGESSRQQSTMALLQQVLAELRRRAVQRLPDAIHYTADRLTAIHQNILQPATRYYKLLPHHDYLTTALLTAMAIYSVRRAFKRVRNAAEVPLEWYAKQKRLKGWCVAVTDSDNIRFYHAPTIFHGPGAQEARSRRLETINVRLAGIDAPEMGHFGGTPQPFSKEAKQWLIDTVGNRRVIVTLHRLDQYNRVVGSVSYYPPGPLWQTLTLLTHPFTSWAPRSLSLDMVRAGLAMVYENAGAEYGGLREKLVKAEAAARKQRIGIWQQDKVVHPSEYKKMRHLQLLQEGALKSAASLGADAGYVGPTKPAPLVKT